MKDLFDDLFSGKRVVVITGAGISTASGIPDFRSENGLYRKRNEEFYKKYPMLSYMPVEYLLSYECMICYPRAFYEFYTMNIVLSDDVKPNICHEVLAELEKEGYISGIITQNIDNLHQEAGSKNVIPIHGCNNFYCINCRTQYSKEHYLEKGYRCNCDEHKGIIRPGIVLYDEGYNRDDYRCCWNLIYEADVIIAAGTSLSVSTVKNFLNSFVGWDDPDKHLYILNKQPTPYDCYSYGQRYNVDLSEAFEKIREEMNLRKENKLLVKK